MGVCVVACALVTSAAACTSMKTVRPTGSASPFHGVQAGDIVSVETRDGRHDRFTVQQIDGDVLVADTGARYARADIVRLQRRSFSAVRTALLIGGALFGLLVGEAGAILSRRYQVRRAGPPSVRRPEQGRVLPHVDTFTREVRTA